ncbi:MAG: hypothetical protein WC919_00355 [Candidatus Paceibacterota bacterium]|jgi:hypothetical protein
MPDIDISKIFPVFPTTDAQDVRAEELIAEWHQHFIDASALRQSEHPERGELDEGAAFECWMIQKIAGLQVLGEYLNERLDMLCNYVGRNVKER